jgi:hypothetical protein
MYQSRKTCFCSSPMSLRGAISVEKMASGLKILQLPEVENVFGDILPPFCFCDVHS